MEGYDLIMWSRVVIDECDHPVDTYYNAELTVNLKATNKVAAKRGIPVCVFHVIVSDDFTKAYLVKERQRSIHCVS